MSTAIIVPDGYKHSYWSHRFLADLTSQFCLRRRRADVARLPCGLAEHAGRPGAQGGRDCLSAECVPAPQILLTRALSAREQCMRRRRSRKRAAPRSYSTARNARTRTRSSLCRLSSLGASRFRSAGSRGGLTGRLRSTLVTGVTMPIPAAALCGTFVVGRVFYHLGECTDS
jgi:hypothetical protein